MCKCLGTGASRARSGKVSVANLLHFAHGRRRRRRDDTDICNTETSIRRIRGHSKTTASSASPRKGTPGTGADKPVHAECAEHVRAKIELQLCCISFTKKEEMPPMLLPV